MPERVTLEELRGYLFKAYNTQHGLKDTPFSVVKCVGTSIRAVTREYELGSGQTGVKQRFNKEAVKIIFDGLCILAATENATKFRRLISPDVIHRASELYNKRDQQE